MTFNEFRDAAKTAEAEYEVAHDEVVALEAALKAAREKRDAAEKTSRNFRWAAEALREVGVEV